MYGTVVITNTTSSLRQITFNTLWNKYSLLLITNKKNIFSWNSVTFLWSVILITRVFGAIDKRVARIHGVD